MSLILPAHYAVSETQTLSLFKDGSGFVCTQDGIVFDFNFELNNEGISIILNDDASWAKLRFEKDSLKGELYSYITDVKNINWPLKSITPVDKPKAKSALQAVRFHDKEALVSLTQGTSKEIWSELLVEAATCGHQEMVEMCLDNGALLHVEYEGFTVDEKASCWALTKAIQYGHYKVVAKLLKAGAHIHHHSFDLDRDNFYHACFLYQARSDIGSLVLESLLSFGIDFAQMSAYYLAAVMYTFPQGPLKHAEENSQMLSKFIEAGARLDDFLMINANDKDTALMFASHMGLFGPLKVLVEAGANVFESYENNNALDRVLHPIVIDPLMPNQGDERIKIYLEGLGLTLHENINEVIQNNEESEAKEEDISSLEALFKDINR